MSSNDQRRGLFHISLIKHSIGSNQSTEKTSMISQDHEQQILTPYQKMIIRSTWRHMSNKGQSSCGDTIMRRLLIKSDRIKTIFHHNIVIEEIFKNNGAPQSIKQHFVEIIQFLHYVMCNLDYPSKISEKCQEIGLQHRKYKKMGMKTEYWDLLGEAISETIREYQGWKRHRESLRAANLLVSYIVDRIRAGFMQRDITPVNKDDNLIRAHSLHKLQSPSLLALNTLPTISRIGSYPLQKTKVATGSSEMALELIFHKRDQYERRRLLPKMPTSSSTLYSNENITQDIKL